MTGRLKLLVLIFLITTGYSFRVHAYQFFTLEQQVSFYEQRYNLPDPYVKLVDNEGNGFDELYGVRNFRAVLKGVYYRGGANNAYDKYGRRPNMNPLPQMGLDHLCEEGFTDAVYLYPTNFSTAKKITACTANASKASASLQYSQISALASGTERQLLTLVYDHITGKKPGPLYAHCWNGWHASGYVAALSLEQFCKWTGAQAASYWIKNTDGNSAGHASIIAKIQRYKPLSGLDITADQATLICPKP